MDTRKKTNAEFQQETCDRLAQHDSMFERILTEMQSLTAAVQALREQDSGRSPGSSSGDSVVVPEDQVQLASFHLDGIAIQWHQWLTKHRGPLTWVEFLQVVLARFGPTEFEDPSKSLSRLKPTTTVAVYQEAFEKLSHQVDGLPESFLIGCFIGGLKEDIRIEVKLNNPKQLHKAIGIARLVEDKMNLGRELSSANNTSNPLSVNQLPGSITQGILGPALTQQLALPAPNHVRRLTSAELRDRHANGLCYNCDERYTPVHKCTKPQLFMIIDSKDESYHLEDKVCSSGVE
ncbi:uncharacterized protein LOC143565426 [Bidens hawaiensis]|uniref:uncharacterized protein LOC143565426 n=1 Tax=Bidens hawaiensis TaxID=980011 RepID=UPI004049DA55